MKRIIAIALIAPIALGLTACKEDGEDVSSSSVRGIQTYHSETFRNDDIIRSAQFGFAWEEGVGDLDPASQVLGRGVWEEPDGDIVTCTRWDDALCLATRESDDGLDALEDLGMIGAAAATGAVVGSQLKSKPKATISKPVRVPAVTSTRSGAARSVQPSKPRATGVKTKRSSGFSSRSTRSSGVKKRR